MANIVRSVIFLLGVGLIIASAVLLIQRQLSGPVAFTNAPASASDLSTAGNDLSENHLVVSRLHIDLPITDAKVTAGQWPLSTTGAIHIAGTNVFYGHNWPKLLGPLRSIAVGDSISIGNVAYTVTELHTVWPSNADILTKASSSTLVVYTCTGFLDTQRFVVIASR